MRVSLNAHAIQLLVAAVAIQLLFASVLSSMVEAESKVTKILWTVPLDHRFHYKATTVEPGDSVRFYWIGLHSVYHYPNGDDCSNTTGRVLIQDHPVASYNFTWKDVGKTFYFVDGIEDFCELGMHVQFTVESPADGSTEPPATASPTFTPSDNETHSPTASPTEEPTCFQCSLCDDESDTHDDFELEEDLNGTSIPVDTTRLQRSSPRSFTFNASAVVETHRPLRAPPVTCSQMAQDALDCQIDRYECPLRQRLFQKSCQCTFVDEEAEDHTSYSTIGRQRTGNHRDSEDKEDYREGSKGDEWEA